MRKCLTALAISVLGTSGCFDIDANDDGIPDPGPIFGYERDEAACRDRRDNDYDRRVDCQDTDCVMLGVCGEIVPDFIPFALENSFDLCSDSIDNDDDGTFDCGDRGCQAIMELCCVNEVDDASCSNAIDDDGNGFADCADFSCRNGLFTTVCEAETDCGNRLDDDGDRRTDCNDSDCTCTDACNPDCIGTEDSFARCGDGLDNDGNGFIDCNDFGCSRSTDPTVMALCAGGGAEGEDLPTEAEALASCMNMRDDDGNGYVDCADFACSAASVYPMVVAYCASIGEDTLARCSDGIDNDNNGYEDCEDHSCSRSMVAEILTHCATVGERSFNRCTNFRDEDGNGFADCGDFSCQDVDAEQVCVIDAVAPAVRETARDAAGAPILCAAGACAAGQTCLTRRPCQESTGSPDQARAACQDRFDNDGDGFVDCEDWDCNYNPALGNLCRDVDGRALVCG